MSDLPLNTRPITTQYCVEGGRALLFLLVCMAAAFSGCGSRTARDEAGKGAVAGSPPAVFAPVQLTTVDRAAFDATIAKHRGKVVLVDFWATWCGPCVEQLPHTIELGRKLADRGLAVVTVSCDDPAESDRVAEFLRSKDASVATNLISQFGASPQSMEAFEIMVSKMNYVVECTKVSGTIDYLVRFVCPDIASYRMLSDELLQLGPKIGNLSSYVVLNSVKPFTGVALDDLVTPG